MNLSRDLAAAQVQLCGAVLFYCLCGFEQLTPGKHCRQMVKEHACLFGASPEYLLMHVTASNAN